MPELPAEEDSMLATKLRNELSQMTFNEDTAPNFITVLIRLANITGRIGNYSEQIKMLKEAMNLHYIHSRSNRDELSVILWSFSQAYGKLQDKEEQKRYQNLACRNIETTLEVRGSEYLEQLFQNYYADDCKSLISSVLRQLRKDRGVRYDSDRSRDSDNEDNSYRCNDSNNSDRFSNQTIAVAPTMHTHWFLVNPPNSIATEAASDRPLSERDSEYSYRGWLGDRQWRGFSLPRFEEDRLPRSSNTFVLTTRREDVHGISPVLGDDEPPIEEDDNSNRP